MIASTATEERTGTIGGIPIRNIWLLMLYASQLFREVGRRNVTVEDDPDAIPDLVAEILAHAVEKRLRRNLSFGYEPAAAVLGRVRGRIDFLRTTRSDLLLRGKIACRFEDLTVDNSLNRYVRGALGAASRLVRRSDLAHRCNALSTAFKRLGVSSGLPTRRGASTLRCGRRDAADQLMLAAAQLVFELLLPTEIAGQRSLPLPSRDIVWVRRLYEKAIGGFYDVVLSPHGWSVRMGETIDWPIERQTAGIERLLPGMRTDIVLAHSTAHRRLVIDTKFTSIVTRGWFRDEVLSSGHLYQLYAYLRSQEGKGDPLLDRASGLLLHPSLGELIDETVVVQGHAIRFATVDLAATAPEIRHHLLRLVQPMRFD
jgi:5-methylcytosine-specific restriction enzyme subunit McrC